MSRPEPERMIEFGPFRLDRASGKLTKQGASIRLRGMPLKLLQRLVEQPGEVIARSELQQILWKGAVFGNFEQGLNTAMNVLRQTLGDSAERASSRRFQVPDTALSPPYALPWVMSAPPKRTRRRGAIGTRNTMATPLRTRNPKPRRRSLADRA